MAFAVAGTLPGARAAEVEALHFRDAAPLGGPADGELIAAAAELGGTFGVASASEPARSVDGDREDRSWLRGQPFGAESRQ